MSTNINALQTPTNLPGLWVLPTISHFFEGVYPQNSLHLDEVNLVDERVALYAPLEVLLRASLMSAEENGLRAKPILGPYSAVSGKCEPQFRSGIMSGYGEPLRVDWWNC